MGIGLLISGAFIAILAWKYGVEKLRTQEVNAKGADVHLPKAYLYRMYVSDSGFGSDHGGLLVITDKGMVPGYLAESVYYSG